MRTIDSLDDVRDGLAALARSDVRLVPVIEQAGAVPLRRRPPGYQGLAQIIVAQMVSKASANAIWARLEAEADGCQPQAIVALSDAQCRRIGLSRAKETTLKGAAQAVVEGAIDPLGLCSLPAEEAIKTLVGIKGIGVWTAEVYLLFCAGHADIFPAGDVALQSAAGHALGLEGRPDAKSLRQIAAAWQPWRGVAARLLWAYYANAMHRGDVVPTG
ncbi:MAG: DNA-3-methyladenine glycosylase [Pseudomonadota bacterium]